MDKLDNCKCNVGYDIYVYSTHIKDGCAMYDLAPVKTATAILPWSPLLGLPFLESLPSYYRVVLRLDHMILETLVSVSSCLCCFFL